MARKFFYVCAGLLCLAVSYHFGARSAQAQAPGNPVVAYMPPCGSFGGGIVTANGDVYISGDCTTWSHSSNVFAGGPVSAKEASWGQLKARYK
jgi:hypothetical protein